MNALVSRIEDSAQGLWDQEFKNLTIVETGVKMLPGSNSRSAIIRSPLYAAWGPAKKAPARLNNFVDENGNEVDVLRRSLMKYDRDPACIDSQTINYVVTSVFGDMIDQSMHTEEMKVVPLEIVVMGKPGTLYEPLPRETSSGWPWNARPRPGYPGKTRFLGINKTVVGKPDDTDHGFPGLGLQFNTEGLDWDLLKKSLISNLSGAKSMTRRLGTIYTGSKKDELRSLKKVKEGDTRYFSGCPIEYLILCRMMFGSFEVWCKKNKILNGMCVGVNPFSDDWDQIARELNRFPYISDGDFKGFDSSQTAEVLWEIGIHIRKLYADEYDNVREALWFDLCFSEHLIGDRVVRFNHSLPSGHPLTTLVNCMYVLFAFQYCWLRAHDNNLTSLLSYRQHVCPKVYGDDSVVAMSEYAASVFEKKPLPELMATMGLEFTSANKVREYTPKSTLEEVTFLKRGFRYEPLLGRYVSPLDLDTIMELPYWTKRQDSDKIYKTNVEIAIVELSQHPQLVYDENLRKIHVGMMRRVQNSPVCYPRWVVLDLLVNGLNRSIGRKMRLYLNTMIFNEIKKQELDNRISPAKVELTALGKARECVIKETIAEFDSSSDDGMILPQGVDPEPGYGAVSGENHVETTHTQSATGLTFENDGEFSIAKVSLTSLSENLLESGESGVSQRDLAQYLGKPYLLGQFIWDATFGPNEALLTYDLPKDLVTQPFFQEKLKGFQNLSATIEVRMAVNTNPFQQGRLMMVFNPLAQYPNMFPGMRGRSLMARTQLPKVELDVCKDTECVMEIPYISPVTHYNMATGDDPMGRLYIVVYSSLFSGANAPQTAEITIWARFKDVKLEVPSAVVPQGRDNTTEDEAAKMAQGTISRVLRTGSHIAASLAKIPTLSSIAAPTSWALGVASGVASAFGYSKPLDETGMSRIVSQQVAHMANADGTDTSKSLAMFASNKVQIIPGFAGNDVDELNIRHFAQRYAFVRAFEWEQIEASGTILATINMTPYAQRAAGVYTQVTPPGIGVYEYLDFTPVGYLGNLFKFYRGAMKIKIKIVKTCYHSGRLKLVYTWSGPVQTGVDTNYTLREILDVRERNEWEFILPYMSNTPYSLCTQDDAVAPKLTIAVLNPLRAPETCYSSAQVIIETAGGPDIEFAVPHEPVGKLFIANDWLTAQGMDDAEHASNINMRGFGETVVYQPRVDYSAACIGEQVTSLLQLCKRFSRCTPSSSIGSGTSDILPFAIGFLNSNDPSMINTTYPCGDYYSLIASCFAMSRGSMRIKCYTSDISAGAWVINAYASDDPTPVLTTFVDNRFDSRSYESTSNGGIAEVSVPQYTRTISRINNFTRSAFVPPVSKYVSPMRLWIRRSGSNGRTLLRAVADDASIGCFLGCPAMLVAYLS
jgi:hypothetical protein